MVKKKAARYFGVFWSGGLNCDLKARSWPKAKSCPHSYPFENEMKRTITTFPSSCLPPLQSES